jgi:diguanylate cyclase (GGDEF)-like protein/PAS domain S-box-containing protein
MIKEPRILILEDIPDDAELAMRELRRAEISFQSKRVETKEGFLEALREFEPDVILSDFNLPQFNALEALGLLKELKNETPFILYTGSLTEEVAVECMKDGAADYILKSSLKRLPSAVLNALEKSEARKAEKKAMDALRESENKLRTLIESMTEGLLQVDTNDRIQFVNKCFCEMVDYTEEELIGTDWSRLLFDEERDLIKQISDSRGKGLNDTYEIRLQKKSGEILWMIVGGAPIKNAEGATIGWIGTFTDITDRKRAEEQLLYDAFHDGLTGLANRALFMDHLQMTIARGRSRHSNHYAVLFLDLDRFKIINDSLGHAKGDELLKFIARRLESCIRTGDLVARLGGDEFVILLTELVEANEVILVAERILEELKTPFNLGGREIYITTSIGITLSESGHTRAEDMLRDADIAMYRAKAKGRAQYQVFNQEMHEDASKQLQIETEMRRALEKGEFCLYYQPIVQLESNRLVGVEALVRWNHPTRGTVSPMEFIPAAEENGLILPLGSWILSESCRQLREWQKRNPLASRLTVSINLSFKQFSQLDLVREVSSIIEKTGVDPRCLKFEVTESHIMENSEIAVAIMNRLREIGAEISLDDFGTGYSSLSYLHRLPIDYLKIDRSFVTRMIESRENAEIIRTIIKLGQNLKMKVIAEGIETPEQLEQLQSLNCEFGQGYLFSKPLESEAAAAFIGQSLAAC